MLAVYGPWNISEGELIQAYMHENRTVSLLYIIYISFIFIIYSLLYFTYYIIVQLVVFY